MADNVGMVIKFTADAKGVTVGTNEIRQAIQSLNSLVHKETPAANQAAERSVSSLMGKFQEFRKEQVQQGRQARFLASEFMSIVPVTGEVGNSIKGLAGLLIEGAAGGLSFGLALEGIKFVMGMVTAESRAAEEQVKNFTIQLTKMRDEAAAVNLEVNKMTLELAGFTPAMIFGAESIRPAEMAFDDLTDAVNRQREALAILRKEELDALGAGGTSYTEGQIAAAETRLAQLEQQLAAQESILAARRLKFKAMVAKEEKSGAPKAAPFEFTSDQPSVLDLLPAQGPKPGADIAFAGSPGMNWDKALKDIEDYVAASKKAAEETKAYWASMGNTIGTVLGNTMAAMIQGTATAADAMKSLAKIVIESMKSAITSYILGAEAAAAFSQAGIPVIGPALAVAGVATIAALLGGLMGQMPSAAGGWDQVPRNTMAYIHKDEMVLPAERASQLRAMLDGGGGGGTFNIYAHDARSFDQYLKDNRLAVVRALGSAAKDRVRG